MDFKNSSTRYSRQ